jgi:putative phage-type endonuclease
MSSKEEIILRTPDQPIQDELAKQFESMSKKDWNEFVIKQGTQVRKLLEIPLPEQRTPEWYEMRQGFITASDWGKVLGVCSYGNGTKSIILAKCGYNKPFQAKSGALAWGIRFEEVATRLYELRRGVKIIEFGCIPHQSIDYLGASPDGITKDGVMLEIKCPYSREITGEVPPHYWAQVQGQLEVCELEICDYLECKMVLYEDLDEYLDDPREEKGILLTFEDPARGDCYMYEYSDFGLNKDEYEKWFIETLDKCTERQWKFVREEFWRCETFSVVRIYRDRKWFNELALPRLTDFWNNEVLHCKENGHEHLIPTKKNTAGSSFGSVISKDDLLLNGIDLEHESSQIALNPKLLTGRYLFSRKGGDDAGGRSDVEVKEVEEEEVIEEVVEKVKKVFTFSKRVIH